MSHTISAPKRYNCGNGGGMGGYCYGCYQMESDDEYGDYVRFEDYEAMHKRHADHANLLVGSLRECVTILSALITLKADSEFKSTYPDPYGALNDARELLGLARLELLSDDPKDQS